MQFIFVSSHKNKWLGESIALSLLNWDFMATFQFYKSVPNRIFFLRANFIKGEIFHKRRNICEPNGLKKTWNMQHSFYLSAAKEIVIHVLSIVWMYMFKKEKRERNKIFVLSLELMRWLTWSYPSQNYWNVSQVKWMFTYLYFTIF